MDLLWLPHLQRILSLISNSLILDFDLKRERKFKTCHQMKCVSRCLLLISLAKQGWCQEMSLFHTTFDGKCVRGAAIKLQHSHHGRGILHNAEHRTPNTKCTV